ncbi:MAG: porin family protein [Alistipes sp.]|nr:porin family protein [Alistipes sp.]
MKKILSAIFATAAIVSAASAQEAGEWTIAPKVNIYTHTGTSVVIGLGTGVRYSITDSFRIEPSAVFMIDNNSTLEFSCDLHYLIPLGDSWSVYPVAGLVANDIIGWSSGVNLGAGFDFAIAEKWDLTAQAKWQAMFHKMRMNPIMITVGASYYF